MCSVAETPSEGEIGKTQGRREVRVHLITIILSKSIYDRIPLSLTHTWRWKKTKGCISKC